MKSYPTYNALAIDLDLHFFDKAKILDCAENRLENGNWFIVTDDGQCHLFDEKGNLDDIRKFHIIRNQHVRKDIKKIIIPDSVTSIGNWAFEYCDNLVDVTIGNNVTSIGHWAFHCCENLKSVFFKGKTLTQVKDMAYYPWGIEDENTIKAELN